MNISLTELTIKNHINTLERGKELPNFLNIPFEMDNGNRGNYNVKTSIQRLNYLLKQLKKASRFYGQKTKRISMNVSDSNTVKIQAAFYVSHLKTSTLLFYPLKSSMRATSNLFRLEVLKQIVPRGICHSGRFSNDADYLHALTEAAKSMGYSVTEYTD